MADITKCVNENSKIKESCYRYTAVDDSLYQSYANFNDNKAIENKEECEDYYPNRKGDRNENI